MQIRHEQTDPESLEKIGIDLIGMLCSGNIEEVARKFGYALSYDRDVSKAISDDLSRELKSMGASYIDKSDLESLPSVKYFPQNDTGLFALVEAFIPTDNGLSILVELVVTTKNGVKHITIEDISAVA